MASSADPPGVDVIGELSADELKALLDDFGVDITPETNDRDAFDINVDDFIESQKKVNTKRATERDVRNVQRWLWDVKREPRVLENIIPDLLNAYLAELFISIRKSDGSEYEPSSLESMKNSIERYLKEKGYSVGLRDRAFDRANRALAAKKQDLKKKGLGRLKNACEALTENDEDKLIESGEISVENPEGLQFGVFYFLGKYFALRGREEHRSLRFGDVVKRKDSSGEEFLEYHERASKTLDGTGKTDFRQTTPRAYAVQSNPERDPVHFYNEFVKHRPKSMLTEDAPMYLTSIPTKRLKPDDETW